VIGVPDGITDRFVYEFKATKNKFLALFRKPVALVQAARAGLLNNCFRLSGLFWVFLGFMGFGVGLNGFWGGFCCLEGF
jgi:hypothetical protein